MADNYLEKQYDDYERHKAAREVARKKQWQRRLRAYQEKIAREKNMSNTPSEASDTSDCDDKAED